MLAGILPEHYWKLTPAETAVLLRGHYLRDAQASMLLAAFLNVHSKRGKVVRMDELSIFAGEDKPPAERKAQTPERQREVLEMITYMMGGEVSGDG